MPEQTPERRRRSADAQRTSWAGNPHWRARRLAIGSVRRTAVHYPDDPTLRDEVLAALELGRAEGVAAATVRVGTDGARVVRTDGAP